MMPNREELRIGPGLFEFFRELKSNNTREWFAANADRYERFVREPLLQFIREFAFRLASISPEFVADARKTGGSLFRIHRDTRFSKDKTPYKTHAGIQFRHRMAKNVHAPGFYLHLEPDECFVAMGIWRPERDALHAIRTYLAAHPKEWMAAREAPSCRRFILEGDRLKRPPAGFDATHPLVEDLKLKSFLFYEDFPDSRALEPDFSDWVAQALQDGFPLVRFLCRALGLPY
ncbi:MAG: DUF2461 domain-containing protein [Acidobacteriota bacterium]